jgi:hypothetical protein
MIGKHIRTFMSISTKSALPGTIGEDSITWRSNEIPTELLNTQKVTPGFVQAFSPSLRERG